MLKNGRISPNTLVVVRVSFTDESGALTDPDMVSFRLRSPCGRRSAYVFGTDAEIQKEEVGVYTADIVPDKAGRWNFRWETTGPKFAQEDSFIVMSSPFFDNCCEDYV